MARVILIRSHRFTRRIFASWGGPAILPGWASCDICGDRFDRHAYAGENFR